MEAFFNAFRNFGNYLISEITFQTEPWYVNYFYYLIILSTIVWGLELIFPWRKNQATFRKDFWLDAFYMFFNFYIFKLLVLAGLSAITFQSFSNILGGEINQISLLESHKLPFWSQVAIFFVAMDFVQWLVHLCLHRFQFLWNFHKVHHSVEEMGFAAHLRYHWMENIFYTPAKYIMLLLIGGFEPNSVFVVYYINIAIGHLNHANLNLDYGILKYILNNPKMHIWHHAFDVPKEHKFGMNFGISLSVWDYIFRTAYIPKSGRDIKLGFNGITKFPKKFINQLIYPFVK